MNQARIIIIFLLLLIISFCGIASSVNVPNNLTAIGDWQTINHDTNQTSSLIHIWEEDNKYYGKIIKIYHPADPTQDRCTHCVGILHNKPFLGLTIINGFVAQGEGKYMNGLILDPRSGKIYHCNMEVTADNRRLKVRGYIGLPLLGQTDIWIRKK